LKIIEKRNDSESYKIDYVLANNPGNESNGQNSFSKAFEALANIPKSLLKITIVPPTPEPAPPAPIIPQPAPATSPAPYTPTPQIAPGPPLPNPEASPNPAPGSQNPEPASPNPFAPSSVSPNPASEPETPLQPAPQSRAARSSISVNSKKRSTESRYWIASVEFLDNTPRQPNTVLYIIIGVITAVALIITVVLIISLNRKKESSLYGPVPAEDIEDNFADNY